jgi:hypothetical protein
MLNEQNDPPKFWRYYGNYSSGNYGVHCLAFRDSYGNEFYYSYKTLVAFRVARFNRLICLQNYWSTTTGKHLNHIEPDHKRRVTQDEFDKLYKVCFPKEEVSRAL